MLEDDAAGKVPAAEEASANRTTIAQVLAMEWVADIQTHVCTFVGEITEVGERYGWSYVSCNSCSTKVVPKSGSLFCPTCNKPCLYPVIRYKLHLRVKDATGSTTVVLFNDEAEKLIKTPARTFTERLNIGEKSVPHEIANLVGKTFVFKIKVTDYNLKDGFENYTVAKIFEAVGAGVKRKVEPAPSATKTAVTPPFGSASSSSPNPLGPITPEKKNLDSKKMKVQE